MKDLGSGIAWFGFWLMLGLWGLGGEVVFVTESVIGGEVIEESVE